ncbi:transcription factor TFIIIC subunit TFC1 KNAG_0B01360 [Huiozyma naganishii CBS 8797]|uniref:Transcription factor IIIC subunit 5 HTH domain-containing protein n=1 Tax=Huiozyma naganishii (strain ATCC MYA-139 / BCRC 22969 / CBS 8797 / KCTC 17520 / NBRC 10181 / NCYC 3082 / Yp74L-3) TaxID=1071383 RepID=J7RGB9_HUIN7|nr:hypothetical protein KNAG_0B01360 [Kazachstania naganishii CBS 8797]CCK68583.1 hypothetical protein KNAG_0B01360 [Kazachstania naganishii CBS 8797]
MSGSRAAEDVTGVLLHGDDAGTGEGVPLKEGPAAKEFTLDIPRIPSVELPLEVSAKPTSVARAIHMCGGLQKVKDAFKETGPLDQQRGLELALNDDTSRFFNEHPIRGKRVPFRDDSIVLKITVPKGTLQRHNGEVSASLASLDSKDYKITPVAIVDNTIKFREMSDFQVKLDNVPAAQEFQGSFGSLEWGPFRKFVDTVPDNDPQPFANINSIVVDRTLPTPNSDFQLPPPPKLSMVGFPHLYKYRGNPLATKKSDGAAEVKGTYIKNYQLFVHDIKESTVIPCKPHPDLRDAYDTARKDRVYPGTKADSNFYGCLEDCLAILRDLFEERPIWVKRHLDGIIPKRIHHTIKIALALVSYRFTMGPWRNTYIKFGVDPRSSHEYAKYQTEYFKIERRLLTSPLVRKNVPSIPTVVFQSNVIRGIDTRFRFTGEYIPWYLMLQIDLLVDEPNIREVYDAVTYLEQPNELTGWFHELDLVKMRRIVKYELGCLAQGNHNFNKYKLKYFKAIQFVRESMINQKPADSAVDADGDVDMDNPHTDSADKFKQTNTGDKEQQQDDDDDDNGVATGEADEATLEAEEAEVDADIPVPETQDDLDADADAENQEQEQELENLDYKTAGFQDVIARIASLAPEEAAQLQQRLSGFVHESKLSQ